MFLHLGSLPLEVSVGCHRRGETRPILNNDIVLSRVRCLRRARLGSGIFRGRYDIVRARQHFSRLAWVDCDWLAVIPRPGQRKKLPSIFLMNLVDFQTRISHTLNKSLIKDLRGWWHALTVVSFIRWGSGGAPRGILHVHLGSRMQRKLQATILLSRAR